MYYTSTSTPSAFIVDSKDRGRKKIYLNSKVYLDNNQEFLIELYNPTQNSVLTDIKINGNVASGNGLILKPGQRFYLDCFVGDKRKFIFKTYEVEDSNESLNAIAKNGCVEISFFKEKVQYNRFNTFNGNLMDHHPMITTIADSYPINSTYTSNGLYSDNMKSINYSDYLAQNTDKNVDYSDYLMKSNSKSFGNVLRSSSLSVSTETGRIEKGDVSQQKFESVNMEFETYCINKISYQILPNSKKPIETKEVETFKNQNFCSNCGTNVKGMRFCPSCGEKN